MPEKSKSKNRVLKIVDDLNDIRDSKTRHTESRKRHFEPDRRRHDRHDSDSDESESPVTVDRKSRYRTSKHATKRKKPNHSRKRHSTVKKHMTESKSSKSKKKSRRKKRRRRPRSRRSSDEAKSSSTASLSESDHELQRKSTHAYESKQSELLATKRSRSRASGVLTSTQEVDNDGLNNVERKPSFDCGNDSCLCNFKQEGTSKECDDTTDCTN